MAIRTIITEPNKLLRQISKPVNSVGKEEQKLLQEVCTNSNVPYQLVSRLLNVEFESQGGSLHSKVFGKIKTELQKEWRDIKDGKEFSDIVKELELEKEQKESVKPSKNKKDGVN